MKTNTEMKNIVELTLEDLVAVSGGVDRESTSNCKYDLFGWLIDLFD